MEDDDTEQTTQFAQMETETIRKLRNMSMVALRYPEYTHFDARFESFVSRNWPRVIPVRITELSRCGFFYTGSNDTVSCFCCGISISDFSNSKSLIIRHIEINPYCCYINHVLWEQQKKSEVTGICSVCKDASACILFLDCMHVTCCLECAHLVKNCPICRRFIQNRIYVFII